MRPVAVIRIPSQALLLVLLAAGVASAAAETRYVTDQYDFNLRAGQSTRYKILRTLPSGTPLEILDVNSKSGYAQVRTEDGLTGYMLTRYLQQEPGARSQLAAMRSRLEELQQAPDALAAKLTQLRREHDTLTAEFERQTDDKQALEQELAEVRQASANAIRINRERLQLQDQVAALSEQVQDLQFQNRELANHRDQRWFMIGAGVITGGILIGLILPNLRLRRRRGSWGSF